MKKPYGIYFLISALIFFPFILPIFGADYFLLDWFTTDDSFYYFKIAQNISTGMGSTFDGISRTNGYHPLWMILLIPVYVVFNSDGISSLRIIVIIQYLLSSGIAIIFFNTIQKRLDIATSFLASIALVLILPVQKVLTNGTESILNLFFLVLLWSRLVFYHSDSTNINKMGIIELSLISIFLLFARLDNIFVVFTFGLVILITRFKESKKNDPILKIKKVAESGLLYGIPILSTLFLYFLTNRLFFDTWMPLSGQIKKYWGLLENTVYGFKVQGKGDFLGEFLSPESSIGPWSLVTRPLINLVENFSVRYYLGTKQVSLGIFLLIFISFIVGYIFNSQKRKLLKCIIDFQLIPLLFSAILHISYYKILGSLAQRSWYWVLEIFIMIALISFLFDAILMYFKQNVGKKAYLIFSSIITFVIVSFLVFPYLDSLNSSGVSKNLDEHLYFKRAKWLESKTEQNSVIGMTGAGSTAYFIQDRMIMNLDGLVNGKEYIDLLKVGKASDYLAASGVKYIFGNDYVFTETEPYKENFQPLLSKAEEVDMFHEKYTLWLIAP